MDVTILCGQKTRLPTVFSRSSDTACNDQLMHDRIEPARGHNTLIGERDTTVSCLNHELHGVFYCKRTAPNGWFACNSGMTAWMWKEGII